MARFFDLTLISIVEGITELLPISSTAHVLFLTKILNISISSLSLSLLQFVAFVPIIICYFVFVCDLIFPWNYKRSFKLFVNLLCMLLPLWSVYMIFGKILFSDFKLMTINLAFGGAVVLFVEKFCGNAKINLITDITTKHALVLGLFQVFSLMPGFSRLGISFVVGRLFKFSRSLSVDVAFLIGIPVVPGFFFCELVTVDAQIEITSMSVLVACCILSFSISALLIKPVIRFLKNNGMIFVAYYRIIVGLSALFYLCVFAN